MERAHSGPHAFAHSFIHSFTHSEGPECLQRLVREENRKKNQSSRRVAPGLAAQVGPFGSPPPQAEFPESNWGRKARAQHKRTNIQPRGRVSGADTEAAGLSSPLPPRSLLAALHAGASQPAQPGGRGEPSSKQPLHSESQQSIRSLPGPVIRLRPPHPNSSRLPFSCHVPGAA